MAKSKVRYGKKDVLPAGPFDPSKSKVRISLFVDGDVIQAFKEAAKKTSHGGYQTLMREKLREAVFGKQIDPELRDTIRQVVREEMNKAS